MVAFEVVDCVGLSQREANVVESVQQAVFAEGVDVEVCVETEVVGDGLGFEVDGELVLGVFRAAVEKGFDFVVGEDGEDEAVLAGVREEDVGEAGGDDGAEAVLMDGPGGVLAGAAAAEVFLGDEDLRAVMMVLVEDEIGVGLAGVRGPPGCGASRRRGTRRSRCARCA